jgi:hypothetical protein
MLLVHDNIGHCSLEGWRLEQGSDHSVQTPIFYVFFCTNNLYATFLLEHLIEHS